MEKIVNFITLIDRMNIEILNFKIVFFFVPWSKQTREGKTHFKFPQKKRKKVHGIV